MDVQSVIETSTAANAAALGNGQATEIFRECVKNNIKVTVNLKPSQKQYLKRIVPFPFMCTGTKTITNDHPVIVALREISRHAYEKTFKISTIAQRALVVGASEREIAMYSENANIHHYVYAGENKDVERIVRPALDKISNKLKLKANKTNKKVFRSADVSDDAIKLRPAIKRYNDIKQVFHDYIECLRLPGNIHTEPVEANVLLFEDSIYNFNNETLTKIFVDTGAMIGYGYAMLPMELLFKDLPANKLYNYSTEGAYSQVTFSHGVSNGYRHLTDSWRTLLVNPVIKHKGVYLMVEIICRVGCMSVFKIIRATKPEKVVRSIGLTENEAFVKILDLQKMYDPVTDRIIRPLQYFSVREDEFFDAVNYMGSLAESSVGLTTCYAYVKRRMNGMSLVTTELVAPWDLPKSQVMPFCVAVVAYVRMTYARLAKYSERQGLKDMFTWWRDVKTRMLKFVKATLKERLEYLHAIIYEHGLEDDLVVIPEHDICQVGAIKWRTKFETMVMGLPSKKYLGQRTEVDAGLYGDHNNEEDLPTCDICLALYGQLGSQQVRCGQKEHSFHEFSLTEGELNDLESKMLDTDSDAPALKDAKSKAREALPKLPFKRKVRVHYIKAGPGCGKSFIVRKLADENDLVLAPFTKLRADYKNLQSQDGTSYDLIFKTQHRGMLTRSIQRIFVDEFTSFPYEFLACIVHNNAAEDVFLVGDEKQTKVIEPAEGIYVGTKINLKELSTHELLVNFRNPPDTVALLNTLYGYEMRAGKNAEDVPSIKFIDVKDDDKTQRTLNMAFSKASATANLENPDCTVRSNQGGTYPNTKVYVDATDKNVIGVSCLQIVALSRHTKSLTVVLDTSEPARNFRGLVDQGEEWVNVYKQYITFAEDNLKKFEKEDPTVARIVGGVDSGCVSMTDSECITEEESAAYRNGVKLSAMSRKERINRLKELTIQHYKNLTETSSDDSFTPDGKTVRVREPGTENFRHVDLLEYYQILNARRDELERIADEEVAPVLRGFVYGMQEPDVNGFCDWHVEYGRVQKPNFDF